MHRGMNISDAQFDLFIGIVAREALDAGVQPEDAAVGKVLGRYRAALPTNELPNGAPTSEPTGEPAW
ncbi:MAG: hypothetical protein MZW92_15595 [Comamonadaceae bacterium]|nr:hypothetical protein [Comamonadaceae bacterium]